jgi:hypothetical protein
VDPVKSALQQRAEIELRHLIDAERSRRSGPRRPPWQAVRRSYSDSEEAERRALESFRFSLEAFAAIGALPKSETENWIARFESEREATGRRPEVPPDAETKRRAHTLLEQRLPGSDLHPESAHYEEAIWRFQEAQAAINITGALSSAEQAEWQKRFLERVSPQDQNRLHNLQQCTGLNLKLVVLGPPIRHDGLRITHVELYSDGLVVHGHHTVEFPKPSGRELTSWERFQASKPDQRLASFDLADDAGTSYRWWPGPSHDAAFRTDGFVHWNSATFTPAVPEEATRLLASRAGNTFEIPLSS